MAVVAGGLLAALSAGCLPEGTEEASARPAGPAREDADHGPLVLYCGRGEDLVGPLIEAFRDESDVDVEVRYGDSAALLAALLDEGTRTPADAFLSFDAVSLGALSRRGLLRELPMDVVRRVPEAFAATEQKHDWVGLTARARTVVFNRATQAPQALPQSLEQLADERFRGRYAIAPASTAFLEHMAVFRVLEGPDKLAALLAGIRDNSPQTLPDDGAVVRAVAQGRVDWGLADHQQVLRELGGGARGRLGTFFMPEGEASALVTASGIGVLSDDPRALALVRFLLGSAAQRRLGGATYEYALTSDAPPSPELPAVAALRTPPVDFADVAAVLPETRAALRRAGMTP